MQYNKIPPESNQISELSKQNQPVLNSATSKDETKNKNDNDNDEEESDGVELVFDMDTNSIVRVKTNQQLNSFGKSSLSPTRNETSSESDGEGLGIVLDLDQRTLTCNNEVVLDLNNHSSTTSRSSNQ